MNGCDGFALQTIQIYPSNIQIDKRNTEGLKGFFGIKNAYKKCFLHAASASDGRAGNIK